MKRASLFVSLSAATLVAPVAYAQPQDAKIAAILKTMGAQPTREIEFDICFPATNEEYQALGKHAILELTTSSAIAAELPLKAVYAEMDGVRIPLQRIALLRKVMPTDRDYTSQISYYLLPIHLMKSTAAIRADFSGDRKDFGFASYSAKDKPDPSMPTFARLDEYDNPSDPDMDVVKDVLIREYADKLPQKSK
jgi:hypothetical protein